jgi:hypothetical protein
LADPAVRSRLADLGVETFPRERQTLEALGTFVKADAQKWWPIIKEFGIKAERPRLPVWVKTSQGAALLARRTLAVR